jgi:hypothetical protein
MRKTIFYFSIIAFLSAKYYTGFAAGDLDTQSYFALGAGQISL